MTGPYEADEADVAEQHTLADDRVDEADDPAALYDEVDEADALDQLRDAEPDDPER